MLFRSDDSVVDDDFEVDDDVDDDFEVDDDVDEDVLEVEVDDRVDEVEVLELRGLAVFAVLGVEFSYTM